MCAIDTTTLQLAKTPKHILFGRLNIHSSDLLSVLKRKTSYCIALSLLLSRDRGTHHCSHHLLELLAK